MLSKMETRKIYIIGAGSVGGHIAYNIRDYLPSFEVAGFFDDDPEKQDSDQHGVPVMGSVEQAIELGPAALVFGIAFPSVKKKLVTLLKKNKSLIFPSLVHKKAWISGSVEIGEGCVIYPGTSVNYASMIGNFVIMNMNCALGHHTKVGNFSSLAPGVNTGGHTNIGEEVELGLGVSTLQNIRIGDRSVVGGQSMVTRDIPPDVTAAGVPAKIRQSV